VRLGCVVLDLSMPGMDGLQLLRELRGIKPGIPAILASGYTDLALKARFAGSARDAFLEKPYNYRTLAAELRRILD